MSFFRFALGIILALALLPHAFAAEQINRFDVLIEVEKNGDIVVTETINVTAEGNQIRRGIFRDLPRYYEDGGSRLRYRYDFDSVTRNSKAEPFATFNEGNARTLRIGQEDVFLPQGEHTYEIRYRVKNQVRHFDEHDEIFWNATGTYWNFPILSASAEVILPDGARATEVNAYTGAFGSDGRDYTYRQNGNRHLFQTTRAFQTREGLTVSVLFGKGFVTPPTAAEERAIWWQKYGALVLLMGTVVALLVYYTRSFDAAGRDPERGPVFPRYEPPEGYSPSAVHYIYYRGMRGHHAVIATLLNLATKKRIRIDQEDKKKTRFLWQSDEPGRNSLSKEDAALERKLFRGGTDFVMDKKYDATFTDAYTEFKQDLSSRYGSDYFKWNRGYNILAIAVTAGAILVAANTSVWTVWHTAVVAALAVINLLFLYLMPAPTRKGQEVRTGIEGFRLYLETAEKLQMNTVDIETGNPPPMTTERYEKFLPYAVALDVEEPWTKYFERQIPEEAENYSPHWTSSSGSGRNVHALTSGLVGAMATGVSASLPQSSSSSGGGGGGFSGGGGGGGGGGGW